MMKIHSSLTIVRFLSIGAFASMLGSAPAAAALPATPITSSSGVPCTQPAEISPDEAFAHPIADPRTLAFISLVKNLNPRERGAVRKRATAPISDAQDAEFTSALAADCSFAEVDYRTSRFVYAISRIWSGYEAVEIEAYGRYALASLLLQDRISSATRDAMLAVFGTSVDDLDARLVKGPSLPAPCSGTISARALSPTQPAYPADAINGNVTGVVQIEVGLDRYGYTEYATLYQKKINPPGAPGDSLVTQAILSAATTDYVPQFVDCKPLPGRYIFRADFDKNPY